MPTVIDIAFGAPHSGIEDELGSGRIVPHLFQQSAAVVAREDQDCILIQSETAQFAA